MDFGLINDSAGDRLSDGRNTVKGKMFVLKALRSVCGGLSDTSNTKLIGDILCDMGRYDEAIYEYKKTIASDPQNKTAFLRLAKSYSLKNYRRLSDDCNCIYQMLTNPLYIKEEASAPKICDSSKSAILLRSAERLISRKEFEKALKILDHADADSAAFRLKAFCLFSLGRFSDALIMCGSETDIMDVFCMAVAAASAYKLGNLTLAYSYIKTINRACITTPGEFYAYAFCMRLCGESAYIMPVLDNILEQHPYDPELMTFCAPLIFNMGNRKRAIQLFGDAIALDNCNFRAKKYIKMIDDGAERLADINDNIRLNIKTACDIRESISKPRSDLTEEQIIRLFVEGNVDSQYMILTEINRAHSDYENLFRLLMLLDMRADIKRNLVVETYCRYCPGSFALLYKGRILYVDNVEISGVSYCLIRPYLHALFNAPSSQNILRDIFVALSLYGYNDKSGALSAAAHCLVNTRICCAYDYNAICSLYGADRGQVIIILKQISEITEKKLLTDRVRK